MSYVVRDENALVGSLAGVEIGNGAGAPTIVAHQLVEVVGIYAATGSGGTAPSFVASTVYTTFLSPPNPSLASGQTPLGQSYKVLGVQVYYATAASGAATVSIEICGPGVANGSGTNVLAASNYALNTALTAANTPQSLPLNTNVDNLTMLPNSRLNFTSGATATTGLVDFTIVAYVARIS